MMNLCKYKDFFGKPKTGVHSYRIFGIALIDVLLTIILAYAIHQHYNYNFTNVLIITLVIGEIFHYMFCVETTVIRFIRKSVS
jgi:hypothetical protein